MSDTATLSRLFSSIDADLDVVNQTFQASATSGLEILNSAAAYTLQSSGKRIRTALTLLSGRLVDYQFEKLLPLSVAFEMVHLATLVHDDIVDKASTRRGIPTVNARYGDSVAILLGDYFFAKTAGLIADVKDFRIDHLDIEAATAGTIANAKNWTMTDNTIKTADGSKVTFTTSTGEANPKDIPYGEPK